MAHTEKQRVPYPIRPRTDFSTGVYNRSLVSRSSRPDPHDTLHMMPGLDYCWCMCAHCWDKNNSCCMCLSCPCVRVVKNA